MSKKDNTRIIVTGATGMVGSHVIKLLWERGYRNIIGIKRESSDMSLVQAYANDVEWRNADVTDITAWDFLGPMDLIIHTAAIVSLADKAVAEMYQVNITGTETIVNAALHAGIKKLIHLSSIAAVGRKENGELTTEDENYDQSADNSTYSKSKYAAEQHVWRGQKEGLTTVILNPSIILGAGFWKKTSAAIIDRTARGLPFYPKGSTGFVDVRDVAKACIRCIELPIHNQRLILNGENLSYYNLFSMLTTELGVKMPQRALPDWMGNFFWRWEKLKSLFSGSAPVVTRHTVNSTRRITRYDNRKSVKMLNMHYIPLQDTLKDIATAYRQSEQQNIDYAVLPFP